MHIAVDCVGTKHSGGATVLSDFLTALVSAPKVSRITVFSSPSILRKFSLPKSDKISDEPQAIAEYSRLSRLWWYDWGLPRRVKEIRADLLFCFNGAGRGPVGTPVVCFVQQALPLSDEALSLLDRAKRMKMAIVRWQAQRCCRLSAKVLVQTPTMVEWLNAKYGIPEWKIQYYMPAPPEFPEPGPPLAQLTCMHEVPPNTRVLYVGNQSAYKNITVLARAMAKVRQVCPSATLFGTWPETDALTRLPGVVGLGFMDKQALAQAYRNATVLVMPSLVETVGFPMLEAMGHSLPVLAADRPYAHDVCGDAALFFDPLDPDDCAEKLLALFACDTLGPLLGKRGKERVANLRKALPYSQMAELVCDLVQNNPGKQEGVTS